jgi:hypothetical protein
LDNLKKPTIGKSIALLAANQAETRLQQPKPLPAKKQAIPLS